jgi:hypothetical protein
MPKDELSELRAVLREAADASRRTYKEIEKALGIGHGTLLRMLDGRLDIRVYHVVGLARLLRVHPKDFLEAAFPDWPAEHQLTEWMTPARRKRLKKPALPSTLEELSELVRGIVQDELAAREAAPASRRPRPAKKS